MHARFLSDYCNFAYSALGFQFALRKARASRRKYAKFYVSSTQQKDRNDYAVPVGWFYLCEIREDPWQKL